ncbi:MAG: bifunctional glutamate N-acetyltransferase/amino-acid acetyltransferase ArgJ [Acidobacteria bacterium]|nr:bifunctional glutamate N-acetyltransferase/amino-acid acetyltransferase ArgJ [Acidobacteriota bacterium]
MRSPTSLSRRILVPPGFRFAGIAAGIKAGAGLDLGLVEAPQGATAAALFTSNRIRAAPLQVGEEHLESSGGRVRAVIVNSGNANCSTRTGRRVCQLICERLAKRLGAIPRQVFPSSTGVIGVELPAGRILQALPRLLEARGDGLASVQHFARAIMTTDTRPKLAAVRFRCGKGTATLLGVAKGAGMIHPRLRPSGYGGQATMLVYLFSDVVATPAQLQRHLHAAAARTFNCISVDGDTSTNDTVLLLASGTGGLRLGASGAEQHFAAALEAVCSSLAEQIVADGEGVRHVVRLRVEGAGSEAEAERVARAIARSPLVKTAWAGGDPNWGRILAAIGASGVPVDPERIEVFLGKQQVCRRGAACRFDEWEAHRCLRRPRFDVKVRLGQGRAVATFLTCDLTTDYVRLNTHYRS